LEVLDQALHMGDRVVNDLADPAAILRVELAEQLFQVLGMILTLGEDDGLAHQGAGLVPDAVVDQVFEDDAVGVFAEDLATDVLACDGGLPRLFFAKILLQLALLRFCELTVVNTVTQEVGGQILDPKGHKIGWIIVDGGIQPELEGRVGGFTVEHVEGVAADELHRRGSQSNLKGIEIIEQVSVLVVDAAVAHVGNDQVEEAHIQLGKAVHHARVGGDVDTRGLIHLAAFTDHTARLAGQVLLEGIVGLHTQFLAITEKQDAFGPAGAQQQFGQGDGNTSLAGARGLNDQRLASLVLEVGGYGLDGFNLVRPVSDAQFRIEALQLFLTVVTLVNQVFETVLAVQA